MVRKNISKHEKWIDKSKSENTTNEHFEEFSIYSNQECKIKWDKISHLTNLQKITFYCIFSVQVIYSHGWETKQYEKVFI